MIYGKVILKSWKIVAIIIINICMFSAIGCVIFEGY